MTPQSSQGSIVIVGAGPNLGAAIARRFGREGPVGNRRRDGHAQLTDLAAPHAPHRAFGAVGERQDLASQRQQRCARRRQRHRFTRPAME
jgi:NAD(P)-dependent dehydrogenase (short-subunit alcohol dehydrogenase family)